MRRLLDFAMFYLGWFACVVGAAHGELWLGPAMVAVLLLFRDVLSTPSVRVQFRRAAPAL